MPKPVYVLASAYILKDFTYKRINQRDIHSENFAVAPRFSKKIPQDLFCHKSKWETRQRPNFVEIE